MEQLKENVLYAITRKAERAYYFNFYYAKLNTFSV